MSDKNVDFMRKTGGEEAEEFALLTQQNKNSSLYKFPVNGYVRRCCSSCIFLQSHDWYSCLYPTYDGIEDDYQNHLDWVPAWQYNLDPLSRERYDEPCPCFLSRHDAFEILRRSVGGVE